MFFILDKYKMIGGGHVNACNGAYFNGSIAAQARAHGLGDL